MKVALINPPFLEKYSKSSRSPAVTKSGTIYYPLWLAYAAGVLDKAGHSLIIIDAPAKGLTLAETIVMLKEFDPQLIVIDTSTPSILSDLTFTQQIKLVFPQVQTCLVGTHATACVDEILPGEAYVDCIARHEYDYTILDLANGMPYRDVLGISYIQDGRTVHNADRPFIQDLDALPFVSEVYYKYLDITDYFYAHVSFPTISIFSSRGCPSKCIYCVYSQTMFGKGYRRRSAYSLFQECVYITKHFPDVKEILIDDDNFAVDQINVRLFCRLMTTHNVILRWVVQVRVTLQYETMCAMKAAGCKLLVAGFESGNQNILNNMHKGITLEESLRFDRNARRAKLRVHGCFMVGNPGETRQTMRETLEFSKRLRLDTVQYFPLMVYPGTEAYDWAKTNDFLDTTEYRDWLKPDGMHNCVLSTDKVSSDELVEFCNQARKEFYLRPKYILKKLGQCLTNTDDFIRTFKSMRTFRKYLFRNPQAEQ